MHLSPSSRLPRRQERQSDAHDRRRRISPASHQRSPHNPPVPSHGARLEPHTRKRCETRGALESLTSLKREARRGRHGPRSGGPSGRPNLLRDALVRAARARSVAAARSAPGPRGSVHAGHERMRRRVRAKRSRRGRQCTRSRSGGRPCAAYDGARAHP